MELEILSNFLTHHLHNRPPSMPSPAWTGVNWGEQFQDYGQTLCQALLDLAQRSQSAGTLQLVVSGLAEVLRQPEFFLKPSAFKPIVQLLEEDQSQLLPLFFEAPLEAPLPEMQPAGFSNVKVWIGSENPIEPMQGCALVVSNYTKQNSLCGQCRGAGPHPYDVRKMLLLWSKQRQITCQTS